MSRVGFNRLGEFLKFTNSEKKTQKQDKAIKCLLLSFFIENNLTHYGLLRHFFSQAGNILLAV